MSQSSLSCSVFGCNFFSNRTTTVKMHFLLCLSLPPTSSEFASSHSASSPHLPAFASSSASSAALDAAELSIPDFFA